MIRVIRKFQKILSRNQKLKICIIVVLMLFGALLETLSVSMMTPFMTVLMQEDIINADSKIGTICRIFGIDSIEKFAIYSIIFMIFLFIFKNIFLFFEYYVQTSFICNNRIKTQQELMESYLHRPYVYFLGASSGEIIRVIKNDVSGTFSLLSAIMSFFTEGIVATALIVTIIIIDYKLALIVGGILALLVIVMSFVIKPILRKASLSQQRNNALTNKWLLQSISGIKDVKVANKEDFFLHKYSEAAHNSVNSEKTYLVLGNAPRLIIEAVSVSAMLGYIGIMISTGVPINSVIPQMSALVVAAVRLLPCANRMSGSLNSISFLEPQLDKTIENIKESYKIDDSETIINRKPNPITLDKSCGFRNLWYSYPNSEEYIFENAELHIEEGYSIGIIGPSGAGKTTAIDILLGLLKPEKGEIFSDGINIFDNYNSWLSNIAYIPQSIFMLDDTIRANVAFGISSQKIDDTLVWEALKEAKMDEFVRGLPDQLDTSIGERGIRLSGGQRQRIGIARALYCCPKLLVFDEATSALDTETENAIIESINSLKGKHTMVIIAHRLSTIANCDIIFRVENKRIEQLSEEEKDRIFQTSTSY